MRKNGCARRRHAREEGAPSPFACLPRARPLILSFAHYFQAPATQAISKLTISSKYLARSGFDTSSETHGQIVGARKSLNGMEKMAQRKVKNVEKIPVLYFSSRLFSARLDFSSPPLSAPGSPRMVLTETTSRI